MKNIDYNQIVCYIKGWDKSKVLYAVMSIAIIILSLLLFRQCNNNSALESEVNRQKNNILAMTDTLTQYKDELGRSVAEKHAYQLTQEELRDSLNIEKEKHVDYITYTRTQLGVRDTIIEKTYIDRIVKDDNYIDNGIIAMEKQDSFGNSSREIKLSIPYAVDSLLHTGDVTLQLNQDIFVESWLTRNSKTGETMVHLRSDYPNIKFNSGMGIVATTSPEYEKSMRKRKGIGFNVGPQVGISYDFINRRVVPTIGVGVGIGFNFTPKKFQW